MSVQTIASRYAKALMDLAVERNAVDTVLENVKMFKEAVSNRDLYLLLKSPIVKESKKIEIFKVLFDGKLDEITDGFFSIIMRKGREEYLPEIADSFITQYKSRQKISSAKITTAAPMSEEKLAEIKATLLKSNITEESIDLEVVVDPSILGGFVIEIGDKLYNASVLHQLNKLKKEFVGNDYVKAY